MGGSSRSNPTHFCQRENSLHAVRIASAGACTASRRRNPAEYHKRARESIVAAPSIFPARSAPTHHPNGYAVQILVRLEKTRKHHGVPTRASTRVSALKSMLVTIPSQHAVPVVNRLGPGLSVQSRLTATIGMSGLNPDLTHHEDPYLG